MVLVKTHRRKTEGIRIRGVTEDSRKVQPGYCFVAIRGTEHDGNRFIPDAVRRGAAMIVVEKDTLIEDEIPEHVGVMYVEDTKIALGELAHGYYGYPTEQWTNIGITGTNGKTTCTYLLEAILRRAGKEPGVIGTIDYRWSGTCKKSTHTTPPAPELAGVLWRMKKEGTVDSLVMEVSSHAIDQHRIQGVDFDLGLFTNISQDHLDYHRNMDNYIRTKWNFFRSHIANNPDGIAVFNIDDNVGEEFSSRFPGNYITYGIHNPDAEVRALEISSSLSETKIDTQIFGRRMEVATPLIGDFNVYNVLGCVATAWAMGISFDDIVEGVASVNGIPGRMESLTDKHPFSIVVDYSHTPKALEMALHTLCKLNPQHIITVFGCGGDRDKDKRHVMGHVAAQYSDYVIITTDNSRSEDPMAIARAAEQGMYDRDIQKTQYEIILDRKEAIYRAIHEAREGGVVLIAGKGHEDYQILEDKTIHFDDREVARIALRERESRCSQ